MGVLLGPNLLMNRPTELWSSGAAIDSINEHCPMHEERKACFSFPFSGRMNMKSHNCEIALILFIYIKNRDD